MPRVLTTAAIFLTLSACREKETLPETPPPPIRAETSVDKAVATTGDLLTYSVVVDYEEGIAVDIPETGAGIAGFRIVDLGRDPPVTKRGRTKQRLWYLLRADLVGSYVLPPFRLTYWVEPSDDQEAKGEVTKLETSEIFVEVASVLPADGEVNDIREIKPLHKVQHGPAWWILLLIFHALLLVATVLYLWLRQRKQAIEIPASPPHEVAYAALDSLRSTNFSDLEALRRYYFALSEVLRAYIEARFELNATDLTSEEIIPKISDLNTLLPAENVRLREFLSETDVVKFAAYRPTTPEVEQTYEKALSFIEATHLRPEEVRHEGS